MEALRKNECPSSFDTLLSIMITRINNSCLNGLPRQLEADYAASGYDMREALSEEMLPGDMAPAANDSGPASMASGAAHGLKRPGSALSDPRPRKGGPCSLLSPFGEPSQDTEPSGMGWINGMCLGLETASALLIDNERMDVLECHCFTIT